MYHPSKEELEELYLHQNIDRRELARRFEVSSKTIGRWLHNYEIPNSPNFGSRNKGEQNPQWKGGIQRTITDHINIKMPEHPRAGRRDGYVPRSILVWEQANQQSFPEDKVPHHDNEIPDDDRPENIVPLAHGEHTRLHNLRRSDRKKKLNKEEK